MKAVEEGVGKTATGLHNALTNYQLLSEAVVGGYTSLEAHMGKNFNPNNFISIWDGIQYFKEKFDLVKTKVKGSQSLTSDRIARATHDVGVALNRITELTHQARKLKLCLDEGQVGAAAISNSLVPNFIPDSIDGAIHLLFYHVAFGIDHFFNRLDFSINRYDKGMEEMSTKLNEMGIAHSPVLELDALKEQVQKLGGWLRSCRPQSIVAWLKLGHRFSTVRRKC